MNQSLHGSFPSLTSGSASTRNSTTKTSSPSRRTRDARSRSRSTSTSTSTSGRQRLSSSSSSSHKAALSPKSSHPKETTAALALDDRDPVKEFKLLQQLKLQQALQRSQTMEERAVKRTVTPQKTKTKPQSLHDSLDNLSSPRSRRSRHHPGDIVATATTEALLLDDPIKDFKSRQQLKLQKSLQRSQHQKTTTSASSPPRESTAVKRTATPQKQRPQSLHDSHPSPTESILKTRQRRASVGTVENHDSMSASLDRSVSFDLTTNQPSSSTTKPKRKTSSGSSSSKRQSAKSSNEDEDKAIARFNESFHAMDTSETSAETPQTTTTPSSTTRRSGSSSSRDRLVKRQLDRSASRERLRRRSASREGKPRTSKFPSNAPRSFPCNPPRSPAPCTSPVTVSKRLCNSTGNLVLEGSSLARENTLLNGTSHHHHHRAQPIEKKMMNSIRRGTSLKQQQQQHQKEEDANADADGKHDVVHRELSKSAHRELARAPTGSSVKVLTGSLTESARELGKSTHRELSEKCSRAWKKYPPGAAKSARETGKSAPNGSLAKVSVTVANSSAKAKGQRNSASYSVSWRGNCEYCCCCCCYGSCRDAEFFPSSSLLHPARMRIPSRMSPGTTRKATTTTGSLEQHSTSSCFLEQYCISFLGMLREQVQKDAHLLV